MHNDFKNCSTTRTQLFGEKSNTKWSKLEEQNNKLIFCLYSLYETSVWKDGVTKKAISTANHKKIQTHMKKNNTHKLFNWFDHFLFLSTCFSESSIAIIQRMENNVKRVKWKRRIKIILLLVYQAKCESGSLR